MALKINFGFSFSSKTDLGFLPAQKPPSKSLFFWSFFGVLGGLCGQSFFLSKGCHQLDFNFFLNWKNSNDQFWIKDGEKCVKMSQRLYSQTSSLCYTPRGLRAPLITADWEEFSVQQPRMAPRHDIFVLGCQQWDKRNESNRGQYFWGYGPTFSDGNFAKNMNIVYGGRRPHGLRISGNDNSKS